MCQESCAKVMLCIVLKISADQTCVCVDHNQGNPQQYEQGTIRDTHLFGSSSRSLPAWFTANVIMFVYLHYMVTFTNVHLSLSPMFTFHFHFHFHYSLQSTVFTFFHFHLHLFTFSTFNPVSSLKQGGTGVVPPVATPFATPSQ